MVFTQQVYVLVIHNIFLNFYEMNPTQPCVLTNIVESTAGVANRIMYNAALVNNYEHVAGYI